MRPRFVGQRSLATAILLYRRWLSGRGPLRRVTCTFGDSESCSAYGLRVVREHATTLVNALALIFGRLQRCRTSSVHRHGHALCWGPQYDALELVDHRASRLHETLRTRAALAATALAIARYRGDERVGELRKRLRSLVPTPERPPRLPLRDGRSLPRRQFARCLKPAVVGLAVAACAAWALPWVFAALAAALALLAVAAATRRFVTNRRRLDAQRRIARFALG